MLVSLADSFPACALACLQACLLLCLRSRLRRWVLQQPLVTAAVIGATSVEQLAELLDAAAQGPLPSELLRAIDVVHAQFPSPTP